MTNNIIDAVILYSNLDSKEFADIYSSSIGINQVGERLEYFVKDLICDSLSINSKEEKDSIHKEHFSWRGSQNNPPDIMLRDSDAIEVKKSKGKHPSIALNSSPPRQKLHSETMRITNECRACEDDIGGWDEKDLLYILGSRVKKNKLGFMWMVYGDCWCASDELYLNISDTVTNQIEEGLSDIPHIEMDGDSNEIGKVRKADELGRTQLRIRGMWSLNHPATEFSEYIDEYEHKISEQQPLFLVMRQTKYDSFSERDRQRIEETENICLHSISVSEPNDSSNEIDCVLIESL